MKLSKKVKLLILIVMSAMTFLIFKYTNNNNISYTVIGDGISYGLDSYGRKTYGYGNYVKDYLKEHKKLKEYSDEYTASDMTIEMLSNILLTNKEKEGENRKKNIKEILRDTDYLTISIGLNDLLYKMAIMKSDNEESLNVIINEIETSFNNLIKEIRMIYNRDIYIIGYYDLNINNKYYKYAIKKLNNIYKNNGDVIYISTYAISENKNIFLPNSTSYYPNYKGYQLISSKIIDKISKKLEN